MLTQTQRDGLLAIARSAIADALGAPPVPVPEVSGIDTVFGGVFVTLRRDGQLRGCIGHFQETTDLASNVRDAARAALDDPRFVAQRVTATELDALEIEISLLSPRVPMNAVEELVPGVHGIYVSVNQRTGCFLPKVATERGWSADEFLANCCTMKAGTDADAWKRDDARVWLFTAEAFSDRDRAAPGAPRRTDGGGDAGRPD